MFVFNSWWVRMFAPILYVPMGNSFKAEHSLATVDLKNVDFLSA